jgi:hypothetical protein
MMIILPSPPFLHGSQSNNILKQNCAGTPLLFVCVLPAWPDSQGITMLMKQSGPFKLQEAVLQKDAHKYVNGFQHFCQDKHLRCKYEGDSLLLWLGTSHVPEGLRPTAESVAAHVQLWAA